MTIKLKGGYFCGHKDKWFRDMHEEEKEDEAPCGECHDVLLKCERSVLIASHILNANTTSRSQSHDSAPGGDTWMRSDDGHFLQAGQSAASPLTGAQRASLFVEAQQDRIADFRQRSTTYSLA